MTVPQEASLLRVYTSSADRYGLSSLFVAIVNAAREHDLAGATVLRGPLGFGHTRRLQHDHLLPFSDDHPVIIEIVDSTEKIDSFLPVLDAMMQSGLVTIERARVLHYGRRKPGWVERFRQQFQHEAPHPPVEGPTASNQSVK
jgi:PII-like signaling protein